MTEFRITKRKNVKSPTGYYYYIAKKGSIGCAVVKCDTRERAEKILEALAQEKQP